MINATFSVKSIGVNEPGDFNIVLRVNDNFTAKFVNQNHELVGTVSVLVKEILYDSSGVCVLFYNGYYQRDLIMEIGDILECSGVGDNGEEIHITITLSQVSLIGGKI